MTKATCGNCRFFWPSLSQADVPGSGYCAEEKPRLFEVRLTQPGPDGQPVQVPAFQSVGPHVKDIRPGCRHWRSTRRWWLLWLA